MSSRLSSWGSKGLLSVVAALVALGPWLLDPGPGAEGLRPFLGRWERVDRRWSLHDYDFARDVLRSLPRGAVVVAKKDVQLFSLWYHCKAEGRRPDLRVVAQGLAGSPWYQSSLRRRGDRAQLGPLQGPEDWKRFYSLNGPLVYATMDAELPGGLKLGPPRGLVLSLNPDEAPSDLPWRFFARRGEERYEAQPDFFQSDLIESYAVSRQRLGEYLGSHGAPDEGVRQLRLGWAMKWLFPAAPAYAGYLLLRQGRLEEAASSYAVALRLFEATLELAHSYRSLPELVSSVRGGAAEAHVNLGVALERLGRKEEAQRHYLEAVRHNPGYAQAHYNLAVTYWGRDWSAVAREMEEVLKLEPGNAEAKRYLEQARARRRPGP